MNKKLLILSLFVVFIAFMAMSYVSAADVDYAVQVNDLDDEYIKDIDLTENENTILKKGKEVKKTVKIKKKLKTYKKTKKMVFNTLDSKKGVKKQIKRAIKGKFAFDTIYSTTKKQTKALKSAKIIKISFKPKKIYSPQFGGWAKEYKVTIKYKPIKYKWVTKNIRAYIHPRMVYPNVQINFKTSFLNNKWRIGEVYSW